MKPVKVAELYRLHDTATLSVPEDSPLEDIVTRFAHGLWLHALFLVDSR